MQPGPRPGRTLAITRPAPKHEATPRLSPHLSGQLTAKPAALYVAESEAQADAESGQDKPLSKAQSALQSGLQSGSMFPESQAESLEQPSQAPQDSGESDPPQAPSRASRGSRQPHMVSLRQSSASQSATRQLVTSRHNRRQDGASTSASPEYPPGLANPNSNGRTVVVSGFKKGMAGPEARQQTLDLCAQFGEVSCCWLRKGKSSCWFTIVQFAEVSLDGVLAPLAVVGEHHLSLWPRYKLMQLPFCLKPVCITQQGLDTFALQDCCKCVRKSADKFLASTACTVCLFG